VHRAVDLRAQLFLYFLEIGVVLMERLRGRKEIAVRINA